MDFALDEQQTLLRDTVRRYLDKSYSFDKRQRLIHQSGGFDAAHWRNFAEMGWLGASLPQALGGSGGGAEEAAIILEEFGKALVVEPFLAISVLCAQTLVGIGGKRADEWCTLLSAGTRRPILAHGEPGARGTVAFVETSATAILHGYRLSGRKTLVLGGPFADQYLVSARQSGCVSDQAGVDLFAVPVDAPGLVRRDMRLADGTRASELLLNDVIVSHEALLGKAGNALPAIGRGYAHAIVALCAEAVGVMDRALWITRDYIQIRRQFGQPIGSFQALQHRMADMLIELELSRSIVFRALAYLDASDGVRDHAVSVAKVQIGKAAKFVGGQSIQLHGSIGITEEYSIGHYFKRLTVLDNIFGTVQMHLERIARLSATVDLAAAVK